MRETLGNMLSRERKLLLYVPFFLLGAPKAFKFRGVSHVRRLGSDVETSGWLMRFTHICGNTYYVGD